MKIFKKFALCLCATVISNYVYADVIELDAINPDHCRQQLLKSSHEVPVIATYDMVDSESFLKKYEMLAKEHPDRTFFKWNAENDKGNLTKTLCLQQLGMSVQPSIMMLGVFKDDHSSTEWMTAPLRLDFAGEMTIAEMNKFIDISDSNNSNLKKSILSLSQKNRR